MKIIVLDGRRMTDRETAHLYLKKKLELPEYYGRNLDALYDCLCEMSGVQIIVTYVPEMKDNLRRYADNILNVLEAAAEKNRKIDVITEEMVDEL
ncbi:MAG: barstar family protein [Oscillospiraceae bacterium]|nr:barstar family protein [Oscillospiraceae bacterium]